MLEKWIILVLVLLSNAYTVVLNLVKWRSANNPTPESVSDVYDAETYGTWKKYSAEHCRLATYATIADCIAALVLLATNAYSSFAILFPPALQLFAVILLESIVGAVIDLVRSYVGTMIIEQKYGFNRSTMKTFVMDRIRSLILGIALSFALAYLISSIHQATGDRMILWFAVAMLAIGLFATFLYPVFSKIGNKFVPLEEGELKERLMNLLQKHGYKVKAIQVMDASRRTTKLNAYFTGFGKMKTIVLFDNLVNAMTPDEICAVFAHELGHGLHKDVLKRQIMSFANFLLMGLIAWFVVSTPALRLSFGFLNLNYGFAFILIGVILGVTQPLTGMAMNAYSRLAEYRADRQAVDEGYGEAMIAALKKLGRENFAHLAPSRSNVVLEYSHPPLNSRIEAILRTMEESQLK